MAADENKLNAIVLQVVLDELSDSFKCDERDVILETILMKDRQHPEYLGTSRIVNYVEETVPTYNDPLFRAHFRMTRSTFQTLLELIGPHTAVRSISLERRTLACLWYLSNAETFRSVADRFGLSKGSLHYYLGNFCRVLSGHHILPAIIYFPEKEDFPRIAEGFAARAGFPGVVGAIDGTYIPIPGPAEFRDSYICRKGFPAFHLQAVCDSNLRFLDVFCAYPGSVHDSRVLRNSPIGQKLEEFGENFHLLGDSAYANQCNLIVPFRDNGHLTSEQKHFNYAHSSTRVDIERCFGLLKGKFRKLKYLDITKVTLIPQIIVSCCALHNFILGNENLVDEVVTEITEYQENIPTDASPETDQDKQTSGSNKRQEIMNMLA